MRKLIVNGKTYENTNSVNIYNLLNYLLFSIDVYLCSTDNEALSWILETNGDQTEKISIGIDGQNGATFPIKYGNAGESFSNPISYNRTSSMPDTKIDLPYDDHVDKKPVYFISGSNHSELGKNWANIPGQILDNEIIDNNEEISWSHGINISFDNMEKDDKVSLEIIPSGSTDLVLLEKYMEKIMIIAMPSLHTKLKKPYFYFDTFNGLPNKALTEEIGVRYK